jgi:hypothetical protein
MLQNKIETQEISLIESIKILLKSDKNNVLFVVPHYVTNIVEIMCILFLSHFNACFSKNCRIFIDRAGPFL